MASRYVVLKKTRQQAVVKVVGSGPVTIPLSDFKLDDETLVAPKAAINYMAWATPSASIECHIVITRGGLDIYDVSGNSEWNIAQFTGFVDTENSDSDITVDFRGDSGSIIMIFTKSGYKEPDTQAWDKTS
jgi:hypothetical protein